MDNQAEVRDFLRTRRERVTPEMAGLIGGGRRRVPGLRREEVALLAGVSADYYAKIERGALLGVSDEVLAALARALHLDEAEIAHLHDLARAAQPRPRPRTAAPTAVRPTLQRVLDAITEAPAFIQNARSDVLAANALGRALYAPILDDPANRANTAVFTFLSPAARTFYREWDQVAESVVAGMRGRAGANPHDRDLTDLIGELVTRSDEFRTRWAAHTIRFHRSGVKRIHHPAVGDLDLAFEVVELPGDPGWGMSVYTTAAGSPSEERIRLLASLAATAAPAPV